MSSEYFNILEYSNFQEYFFVTYESIFCNVYLILSKFLYCLYLFTMYIVLNELIEIYTFI